MIQEPQGLPYSTTWIRAAHASIGNHKSEAVIRFDGKLTEYEPETDALDALLKIQFVGHTRKDTFPAVVAFAQQYGPLGLFFSQTPPMTAAEYDTGTYPFAEYWMKHHSRKLSHTKMLDWVKSFHEPAEVFSHGYFENLDWVWFILGQLQVRASMFSDNSEDFPFISDVLRYESSLRPAIRLHNGHVEWSFSFSTLPDALLGLMVRRIVGGATLATCKPCGQMFTSYGRKYCSDACMLEAQEIKRRNNNLLKEKRRLRELLRTRVEKHGLALKKAKAIRLVINEAPDTAALDSVKETYRDIFARHTHNVESEKGRRNGRTH
jgi:hypothetical protein